MSAFAFRAIDLAGVPSRGELEADSKQAVADQLKSRGLIVLEINDARQSLNIDFDRFRPLKLRDLAVMTRQLSTMISSGMTILRALYVLESQTENKKLQEILVAVRKDVEAGLPLSDAFEQHPKAHDAPAPNPVAYAPIPQEGQRSAVETNPFSHEC